MKLKKIVGSFLQNQKGIGLIGAVIAAALVVVTALTVSYFIVDQNKISVKMENSMQCQQVLKTVMDYIDKDNNSLFITSYGPQGNATTYPTGRDFTPEGIDRFNFVQGGGGVQVLYGPNSTLRFGGPASHATNSTPQQVPANYKFTNSLNIKNTMNRMITAAYARPGMCCADLEDMMGNDGTANPVCGTIFENLPGLVINEPDVRIIVGVNFSDDTSAAPFCPNPASGPQIPVAGDRATAKIRVQVFTNADNAQERRYCTGETTSYFSDDNVPPMVLLSDLTNVTPIQGAVYSCNALGSNIQFDVRAVTHRNAATNSCTQCFRTLPNPYTNPLPDPIELCSVGANSPCMETDPGTVFLCRIGEKNWFDLNKDHWEPCNQTAVYGCTGGVSPNTCTGRQQLGTVTIQYQDSGNNPTTTARGTRATITLSGLTDQRAYEVDVRAVDTRGVLVGPSFEGIGASIVPRPTYFAPGVSSFVTTRDPPTLVNLTDRSSLIERAGYADGSLTVNNHTQVFSQFAGEYQCLPGSVDFFGTIAYASMPPFVYGPLNTEECNLTANGGIPATSVVSASCACADGECFGSVAIPNVGGTWSATMEVENVCGAVGTPDTTDPWCFEDNTASSFGSMNISGQATAIPTLNLLAPNTKKCPISAGTGNFAVPANITYPTINPGATRTTSFATLGWSASANSGCVDEWMSMQACTVMTDACGRQGTGGTIYHSYLDNGPTTNSCLQVNGTQVDGNRCIAGSYCQGATGDNGSYKCATGNTNVGQPCYSNPTGISIPTNDPVNPCAHTTDCGFGKPAYHVAGSCNGDTYACEANSDPALRVMGICSNAGGPCDIINSCVGTRSRCHDGSGNLVLPEKTCGTCNAGIGEVCRQVNDSGTCTYGGNDCDNIAADGEECLDFPGDCEVERQGTCQAPNNTSCQDCPNNGDILTCPRLNGGCDNANPVLPTGNRSCASPPVVCTLGPCVRGAELNRTQCFDAGGNLADYGEAGTETVTYSRTCDPFCPTCSCANETVVQACVGSEIRLESGCFVDTHAYDRPSQFEMCQYCCGMSGIVTCSVGQRLHPWGPGGSAGDHYIFDNISDFTILWTSSGGCNGNSTNGCTEQNSSNNYQGQIRVSVTHNASGRVWSFVNTVNKSNYQAFGDPDDCPPIP